MLFFTRRVAGVPFYSDQPPAGVPKFSAKDRLFLGEEAVDQRVQEWLARKARSHELVSPGLAALDDVVVNADVLGKAHAASLRARKGMALALIQAGESAAIVFDRTGVSPSTFRSWLYADRGKPAARLLVSQEALDEFDEHAMKVAYARAQEALEFDVLRLKRRTIRNARDGRFNSLLEEFHEKHHGWAVDSDRPYLYRLVGAEDLDAIREKIAGILHEEALEKYRL